TAWPWPQSQPGPRHPFPDARSCDHPDSARTFSAPAPEGVVPFTVMSTSCDDSNAGGSCCVVWHVVGTAAPRELVERLSKRNVRIQACSSAYSATAQACLINRKNAQAQRRGSENAGNVHARHREEDQGRTQGGEAVVLILVDPQRLPLAQSVVE